MKPRTIFTALITMPAIARPLYVTSLGPVKFFTLLRPTIEQIKPTSPIKKEKMKPTSAIVFFCATGADCVAVGTVLTVTPQLGQITAPSSISFPQFLQNIFLSSLVFFKYFTIILGRHAFFP